MKVIRKDNRFRVEGQEISLDWLADTRANRKAAVVFLRLLSTNRGKPLFTHKQMLLANLNQAAKAENRGVLVCEGIFFISQSIALVRRSRCDVKVMETETFRSVISKVAYFSVYPFLTVICLLAVNFDEKW